MAGARVASRLQALSALRRRVLWRPWLRVKTMLLETKPAPSAVISPHDDGVLERTLIRAECPPKYLRRSKEKVTLVAISRGLPTLPLEALTPQASR